MHLTRAAQEHRAAPYALAAAERAEAALAFVRAATLYRLALAGSVKDREVLLERLGDCLAAAGYGPEAAQTYVQAAALSKAPLQLKHKAAAQLLRSGHIDQGMEVIREVLAALGMSVAQGPRLQLAQLVRSRIAVRMRGLRFFSRSPSQVEPEALAKIDALWSVSTGLAMVDSTVASDFQSRGLLLALQAGEPSRLARALAMEASFSAAAGRPAASRTRDLLERAQALSQELGEPYLVALCSMARGSCAFLEGRFEEGHTASKRAEALFKANCQGVAWEVATTQIFQVMSMAWLGQLDALRRFVQRNLDEALRRGDRYGAANLRSGPANLAWLVVDDVEGAKQALALTRANLTRPQLTLPKVYELLARMNIALYEGRGQEADQTLLAQRAQLERSLALKVQYLRIEVRFLCARAALASGALQRAAADAQLLRKEEAPHARALANLVDAQISQRRMDTAQATKGYGRARDAFLRLSMPMHAAVASLCEHRQDSDAWFSKQQVARPLRFARMIAPVIDER